MIYVATLRDFLMLMAVAGGLAVLARISGRYRSASIRIVGGIAGSVLAYIVAPLVGALVGIVPTVMIEPQYFTEPFMGCIAPSALFLSFATSLLGVLLGFGSGCYFAIHRRGTHAA